VATQTKNDAAAAEARRLEAQRRAEAARRAEEARRAAEAQNAARKLKTTTITGPARTLDGLDAKGGDVQRRARLLGEPQTAARALDGGPTVKAHRLGTTGNQFPSGVEPGTGTAGLAPAKPDQAKVDQAAKDFADAVKNQPPLEATKKLDTTLEGLSPEERGAFLDRSKQSVQDLTEKLTGLDKGQTAQAVKDLAKATDLAGPANAEKLTRPIATAIADGKLEQKGDDANGGWGGVFRGANTHNSEREFVDGIKDLKGAPGADLFQSALTKSLSDEGKASQGDRADRASGFAGAVVTGKSDLVPDDGAWTGLRNVGKDVVGLVEGAANKVEELRKNALNGALDATLNLSDSVKSLKPGDQLTIGANGSVSAEIDAEAAGSVEVKRNTDGTYSVRAEASAVVGIGALDNKLDVGGTGKVEFKFDTLDQALSGTQALVKTGLATGGQSVLPGLATAAAPSPDEVKNLTSHLSAVELDASAVAKLDARFGLTNVMSAGAEGKLKFDQGMRVEFKDGKPSAVVATAQLKGEAAAEASNVLKDLALKQLPPERIEEFKSKYGFDPRDVKGTVTAEAGVTLQVRTPITTEPVPGGSPTTQLKALLDDPSKATTGPTTASIQLDGNAKANSAGVNFSLHLDNVEPAKLGTFVSQLADGKPEAAVASTGGALSAQFGFFTDESRGWANHGLDLGVAGVEGKNVIRRQGEQYQVTVSPTDDRQHLQFKVEDTPPSNGLSRMEPYF